MPSAGEGLGQFDSTAVRYATAPSMAAGYGTALDARLGFQAGHAGSIPVARSHELAGQTLIRPWRAHPWSMKYWVSPWRTPLPLGAVGEPERQTGVGGQHVLAIS